MSLRDTRFNSTAEMLVRLVFASRYVFFLAGIFLALSALSHGSLVEALKALVCFASALASHDWLVRHEKLESCNRAFEALCSGIPLPEDGDELEVLLARREALESQRGTPGFDPWAVQVLRREISDYVSHHPEAGARLDGRR
ncbi:MAG: hypothetical protein WC205_01400 [Opitutaceae bacterium]